MRRQLVAVVTTALLGAGILSGGGVPAAAQEQPQTVTQTRGGLQLEAGPLASVYESGETAVIEAKVTNTSDATLTYWLPTPCDPLFSVTLTTENGHSAGSMVRESDLGREPMACIQVVRNLAIEPGEAYTERYAWPVNAQTETGTYTVTVRFAGQSVVDAPVPAVSFALQIGTEAGGSGSGGSDGDSSGLTADLTDLVGHWATESVRQAIRLGFVNGYPDATFRPDAGVTRAEVLKMLVTSLALDMHPAGEMARMGAGAGADGSMGMAVSAFADAAGHWAEANGYLDAAVEAAILQQGDFGMTLSADSAVTRAEVGRMVVRALGLERSALMVGSGSLPFHDAPSVPAWSGGYLTMAHSLGIIQGYDDVTVRADRPVTRAEAVMMILRTLQSGSVRIDSGARLEVNGLPVATGGVSVLERDPQVARAPLAEAAMAIGIEVTSQSGGWYLLTRDAAELFVKAGIPYGLDRQGARVPLDGTMPIVIDGKLYVGAATFRALGLDAQYETDAKRFRITMR